MIKSQRSSSIAASQSLLSKSKDKSKEKSNANTSFRTTYSHSPPKPAVSSDNSSLLPIAFMPQASPSKRRASLCDAVTNLNSTQGRNTAKNSKHSLPPADSGKIYCTAMVDQASQTDDVCISPLYVSDLSAGELVLNLRAIQDSISSLQSQLNKIVLMHSDKPANQQNPAAYPNLGSTELTGSVNNRMVQQNAHSNIYTKGLGSDICSRNLEHNQCNGNVNGFCQPVNNNHTQTVTNLNNIPEIRVDGVPECNETNYWARMEFDRTYIIKILQHLDAECSPVNIRRIGKASPSKPRRIIFQIQDMYLFKKAIANAKKLKNFETKGIFLNRNLIGDEAKAEKSMLRLRWQLINVKKIPRSSIAYRHGQIFVNRELYLPSEVENLTQIPVNADNILAQNPVQGSSSSIKEIIPSLTCEGSHLPL